MLLSCLSLPHTLAPALVPFFLPLSLVGPQRQRPGTQVGDGTPACRVGQGQGPALSGLPRPSQLGRGRQGRGQCPALTYLCRPARRPQCGRSCSGPRGFGDSPAGPALLLHSPHRPSTQALSQAQIGHPQGQPAPPRSPAPGRLLQHLEGPIRRHTQSPSGHHARPPGGRHSGGGLRPGAAGLGGGGKGESGGGRVQADSSSSGPQLSRTEPSAASMLGEQRPEGAYLGGGPQLLAKGLEWTWPA